MKIIISVALAFFLLGCSDDSGASSAKQDIFKDGNSKVESVAESTPEVVETAVAIVEETAEVVVEQSTEVVEEVKAEVTATKSGADLFKVCSSCHGQNGEKQALNKSKVIQGWGEAQTAAALNGYKDGSYGGAMKGLMKSQVTKLSDEDISVLSKYISGL